MIKKIIFTLQVLVMIFASTTIYADDTKPAIIIRFQNENIQYQHSLQMLINKALKNHPNLIFKIVANIPSNNQSAKRLAQTEVTAIKAEMIDRNIKNSNIEISFKENNQLNYNEIYIYVRESL
jgi:hypothetical protein